MGKCCCVQYYVPGPWSHAEEHIIIKVSPIWQRIMSLGHDIVMVLGSGPWSSVPGPRSWVLGPWSPGPLF